SVDISLLNKSICNHLGIHENLGLYYLSVLKSIGLYPISRIAFSCWDHFCFVMSYYNYHVFIGTNFTRYKAFHFKVFILSLEHFHNFFYTSESTGKGNERRARPDPYNIFTENGKNGRDIFTGKILVHLLNNLLISHVFSNLYL